MTRVRKRNNFNKPAPKFPVCEETGNEMNFGVLNSLPVYMNSIVKVYDPTSSSFDKRRAYRYRLSDLPPGMKIYATDPLLTNAPLFITGNEIPEKIRGIEYDLEDD